MLNTQATAPCTAVATHMESSSALQHRRSQVLLCHTYGVKFWSAAHMEPNTALQNIWGQLWVCNRGSPHHCWVPGQPTASPCPACQEHVQSRCGCSLQCCCWHLFQRWRHWSASPLAQMGQPPAQCITILLALH